MVRVKPYSEACERNRDPILQVLRDDFAQARSVLEVGSGSGQHAVYFARHLPHLTWHTSDAVVYHAGIEAWIADSGLSNVKHPLTLDVRDTPWPLVSVDAIFSANTLHIMDSDCVEAFFRGAARLLPVGGMLAIYGPFNYGGRFTSASNARFDADLRARGVGSAIRDFEAVNALARHIGLALVRDVEMPANNRTLVWRRESLPAETA
jgi:cyclopropane fatty-acyl-phospholipid synthase-like methyltransferase